MVPGRIVRSSQAAPMIDGVVVALAAAACFEWAYVVQAEQARAETESLRLSLLARLVRNWRWLAGTALTGVGAVLQVWALSLAPVTVVQPALALGLLSLPFLARFKLGERLRAADHVGIAAIVAGVSLIAVFAPDHAGRAPVGTGLAVVLVTLGAVTLAPYLLRLYGFGAVAGAAAGDAFAALCLKLAADELERDRIGPAALWGAAAVAGGLAALTAEMSALQRLRATQIAPVVVAAQVLVPVTVALAFLGETWSDTPGGGALLAAAVAIVVAGGAMLAASRSVEEIVAAEPPQDDLGGGR
jgi:drug/metabolite transporter (DMT)-like permease